ncbi:prolyl oligopeptidase family-domain-containing protein [Xylariales sp. PMI_506]|nr:prolyl oligopeptidase family-domain-containing protein [Xylariales sp. PMI_506]
MPTMTTLEEYQWDWLEQPDAPECLEWVKRENTITTSKIDALPNSIELQSQFQDLVERNQPCPEFWIADKLFRLVRSVDHKQGILEVAELGATPGEWCQVIDIGELGKAEGKNFEFFSFNLPSCILTPDASRLLLMLSDGGSDLVQVREVDVTSGLVVPDGFRTEEGRITAAWLDVNHVLISHTTCGAGAAKSGWPVSSYIWTRGTHLRDAKLVYSGQHSDSFQLVCCFGAGTGRGMIIRALDYSTLEYRLVSLDGTVEEVKLPSKLAINTPPQSTSNHIIVSILESTIVRGRKVPEGTVLAYSANSKLPPEERISVVYSPEEGEVNQHLAIDGLRASYSRVYMTLSKRGVDRRLVFEFIEQNWRLVHVTHNLIGTVAIISEADRSTNNAILRQSGLLNPTSYCVQNTQGEAILIWQQSSVFNSSAFEMQLHSANSKDGTPIDYVMLSPKDSDPVVGATRVLMTGYGAFGLSINLSYLDFFLGGISIVPWLESGGSLVIPFVRGGGERGEQWHQAARQEKRQNSYDDFIAVAEKLVIDRVAIAGQIGVYGWSNGGLLAAVVGIQRPDLFGAVVSDAPLTDMLRFHLQGMGTNWIYEYGDPEQSVMIPVLRSYSPFHNVKEGVKYPAFLATSSTTDDRVGPGHARKLVARLKEVGSLNAFLLEDQEGGHQVSDPFKNTALMGRRIAFLIDHLR